MTLNDKDGKQYGEVIYKPDDILLFHPHTWHGWINGDKLFEFLGFDMQEKQVTPTYRREQKDHPVPSSRRRRICFRGGNRDQDPSSQPLALDPGRLVDGRA